MDRVKLTAPTTVATQPFLEFVLGHAQVKTNVCSCPTSEDGYALQPRTVPDYNLIFVRRGEVTWVVEDQEFPLRRGDLVLVPPAVRHHAHGPPKPVTLGSIHVEVTLPGGQNVFELLPPPRVRHMSEDSRLSRYLDQVISEWERPDWAQTMLTMSSWSRLVVLELLRHDMSMGTLRQCSIDPLVAQVLEEMNHRIDRPTTLDDLAKWSGYSPQYLNRIFGRTLGVTPLKYLGRMKMERAAQMLVDGRFTVASIATAVGFEDPYYFSRVFRQHFGRSPAQYRDAASSKYPS